MATIDINEIKYDNLDEKQKDAVNKIVDTNQNLFIQGQAGTGKSAVIKIAEQRCKEKKKNVVLLAFTGLAAENIGGVTINSQFMLAPRYLYKKEHYKEVSEALIDTDVLIIDEISMVTPDLFEVIDHLCKIAAGTQDKPSNKPFGGKQVVLVGDLYQLGPFHKPEKNAKNPELQQKEINEYFESFCDEEYRKKYVHKNKQGQNEPDEPFFFDTLVYGYANFEQIKLNKVHRVNGKDKDSVGFLENLFNLSRGNHISETIDYFNRICHIEKEPADSVIITLRNDTVDEENEKKYNKLTGEEHVFDMKGDWVFPSYIKELISQGKDKKYIDRLKNQKPDRFEQYLKLRVGAKVMFVKNNRSEGYVNGTIGVVKYFIKEDNMIVPVVEITRGERKGQKIKAYPITVQNEIYDVQDGKLQKRKIGEVTQIPLVLAFALTVNKSQGQTLDGVYVKTDDVFWGYGQLYVALSRVKNLADLKLYRNITMNDVHVSQRVKDFLDDANDTFDMAEEAEQSEYCDNINENSVVVKIAKLESTVVAILEQIREIKQGLLNDTHEQQASEPNEISQFVDSDAELYEQVEEDDLEPENIQSASITKEISINDRIENIFNKYELSVDVLGCPGELEDVGVRRKIKNFYKNIQSKTIEQIRKVNDIYIKSHIKHNDVFKALLFIPDDKDRIEVLNLLEKRDNIKIEDKRRLVVYPKKHSSIDQMLQRKYINWMLGKSNSVRTIMSAYFVACLKYRPDLVTRSMLFDLCQQEKGSLYLLPDIFNDTFNQIKGITKFKTKQLFSNDLPVKDGPVLLYENIKTDVLAMYRMGLFNIPDLNKYIDPEYNNLISEDKFREQYMPYDVLQEKAEMQEEKEYDEIQIQKDFFDMFESNESKLCKVLKAFFDIKKRKGADYQVLKTDLITLCCENEQSDLYMSKTDLDATLNDNKNIIIEQRSFVRLVSEYANKLKMFYDAGCFESINLTPEEGHRLVIKHMPINELVEKYFIPYLQNISRSDIQRLKDRTYNYSDFGFAPLLYDRKPEKQKCYKVCLGEEDYYVLKEWDEKHKDKLLYWLKYRNIIK